MRHVPLDGWKPAPHHAYFGHVAATPDGLAVGFLLSRAGSGRMPCRGADEDMTDGYDGAVCRWNTRSDGAGESAPASGVTVQYLRDGVPVSDTLTDAKGRHTVWLQPDTYEYRYVLPTGTATELTRVIVRAGHTVQWEEAAATLAPAPEENAPGAFFGSDPAPAAAAPGPVVVAREVGLVVEDFICEWSALADGVPFSWADVEEVLDVACQRVRAAGSDVRQISFSKFVRPDLISALSNRGINAVDIHWNDPAFAAAYRNIPALIRAGLYQRLVYFPADEQIRNVLSFATENRVVALSGASRHLADCRAVTAYFAARCAAEEAPGAVHMQLLGSAARAAGEHVPKTPEQSFAGIQRSFGIGRSLPSGPVGPPARPFAGARKPNFSL